MFFFFRDNLVLLQVGFKSLSYEMQEQQPAYDSNSLFGKTIFILICFPSQHKEKANHSSYLS